jgi:hypothetical protein
MRLPQSALLMGLGTMMLCGCGVAAQSSSRTPPREPDCSFRSAGTCWTLATRFPAREGPLHAGRAARRRPARRVVHAHAGGRGEPHARRVDPARGCAEVARTVAGRSHCGCVSPGSETDFDRGSRAPNEPALLRPVTKERVGPRVGPRLGPRFGPPPGCRDRCRVRRRTDRCG